MVSSIVINILRYMNLEIHKLDNLMYNSFDDQLKVIPSYYLSGERSKTQGVQTTLKCHFRRLKVCSE